MLPLITLSFAGLLKANQAYLDPGSGSFILQLLLATLLGGAFILKTYWRRITGFFRSKSSKENDAQDPQDQ